ncbi:hypothetical protein, partial [Bacillus anthracis]|uniref:hypothetical protein n=1 Tax=Bacillus anthracis TaxID=1392 RepID=UPI001E4A11D0
GLGDVYKRMPYVPINLRINCSPKRKKKHRSVKPLFFFLINIFIGKYFELSGTDAPSILL